jgi:protoporphyrinogen oxidase
MGTAIVVGGGISGILSALLLRERGLETVLVERAPKLGGLLSSEISPAGDSFDYGTHYLVQTGHEKIDALLFPGAWRRDWIELPYLKAGNYFQGRLNDQCMFPDTGLLPPDLARRGVEELLALRDDAPAEGSLDRFLAATFGPAFTRAVFEPIVEARLGLPLAELYCNGHALIGLNRLLILDAETTRRLKRESPAYDRKIGFHSYREGVRPTRSYYPREGGTKVWIDLLEQRLAEAGVTVLKSATLSRIEHRTGKATSVHFADRAPMDCDAVFWTLPVSAFLKACGLPTLIEPPQIRTTSHFHFAVDRPPPTDLYYFLCNDPAKLGYRATLYSNVQPERAARTGRYTVSVEVLSAPIADVEAASQRIFGELAEMGGVAPDAQLLWKSGRSGVSGIPVITPRFVEQTQRQVQAMEGRMENAFFSGMVPGVSFFKKEVLLQSFEQIARLA